MLKNITQTAILCTLFLLPCCAHASKENYAQYMSPQKYKVQKQQAQWARSASPELLAENTDCVLRCRTMRRSTKTDQEAFISCMKQCKKMFCTALCKTQSKPGDSPRKLIECIKHCRK